MATAKAKSSSEFDSLFTQLAEPVDSDEIKWRVTHTTQDGRRGAVIPFANPRAYTDRLNQIFSPNSWTRSFDVSTLSGLSRMKRDKVIQTGKILITCALSVHELGTHAGSGEDWADEQNAMTSAEAQAFKRACSCFGLGRYLYNFAEMWVPLNEHRQPLEFPALPLWALPKAVATERKSNPASGPRPPVVQRGPIDQKTTARIEGFRRILGDSIYGEILWRAAQARRANAIPNAELQGNVAEAMERAARGINRAHYLSDEVGDSRFIAVLDRLQIGSMTTIRNLEALKRLVEELEQVAGRQAA
jgi:hypothetical protein